MNTHPRATLEAFREDSVKHGAQDLHPLLPSSSTSRVTASTVRGIITYDGREDVNRSGVSRESAPYESTTKNSIFQEALKRGGEGDGDGDGGGQ